MLVWACGHFPLVIWHIFYERIWKEHIWTWTLWCLVAMNAEWKDTLTSSMVMCPRFILLFTLIPIYFRFLHFFFATPPLLFLYYCSLVNPVYVFLTLCNLLSLICDLPPLTDLLSAFLSLWFSWLLCIGFSIQILHMNKRKWELPEICTGAERHKIVASWDKRQQAHREKKKMLVREEAGYRNFLYQRKGRSGWEQ